MYVNVVRLRDPYRERATVPVDDSAVEAFAD